MLSWHIDNEVPELGGFDLPLCKEVAMKHRSYLILIVGVFGLVCLSSGCSKKTGKALCEQIKPEKVLANWKTIMAEIKDGRVCRGPHMADLLVIHYEGRRKGVLVETKTLVDRWAAIMEKKLGFVAKQPWRGTGTYRSAVYAKKGEPKKIYMVSIVPDSDQEHMVKIYSVRLHTENM
jgi:hypothetical protein